MQVSQIDLERLGEEQGYRLNVRAFDKGEELKTASDGRTVLIPQPTDHPSDPLTWSSRKKHTTLFTITMISFLADFGSAIGIPSVVPQAMYVVSTPIPSLLCSLIQRMESPSRDRSTQPQRKHLLPWSRRLRGYSAVRILWASAHPAPLPHYCYDHRSLGWRCELIQVVSCGTHLKWTILRSRSIWRFALDQGGVLLP